MRYFRSVHISSLLVFTLWCASSANAQVTFEGSTKTIFDEVTSEVEKGFELVPIPSTHFHIVDQTENVPGFGDLADPPIYAGTEAQTAIVLPSANTAATDRIIIHQINGLPFRLDTFDGAKPFLQEPPLFPNATHIVVTGTTMDGETMAYKCMLVDPDGPHQSNW